MKIGQEITITKSVAFAPGGKEDQVWTVTKVTNTQITATKDGVTKRFYIHNGWEVGAMAQTFARPFYQIEK